MLQPRGLTDERTADWRGGPAQFQGGPVDESVQVDVIAAANKPDVLNRMLLPSLRRQSVRWTLRVVDATAEGLSGCAAALNRGADNATAPWLMFVHQDVAFDDSNFLRHAIELMTPVDDLGVGGPVGVAARRVSGRQRVIGRWLQSDPARLIEINPPDRMTPCQTLDELLLFIPRAVFERQKFDPDACVGWHLYGVDYALSVTRLGRRPYVLPILVHHLSAGELDNSYFDSLRRVVRKHRRHFKSISTTFGNWPTRIPTFFLKPFHNCRLISRVFRQRLRFFIPTPPGKSMG